MEMSSAPKDGTRILVKTYTFSYHNGGFIRSGFRHVECWWKDNKWKVWCGNEHTSSTDFVDPVAWFPIPEEE